MVTTNKFIIFLLVFVMSLDKVMKARNKEKEDDVTNMWFWKTNERWKGLVWD